MSYKVFLNKEWLYFGYEDIKRYATFLLLTDNPIVPDEGYKLCYFIMDLTTGQCYWINVDSFTTKLVEL